MLHLRSQKTYMNHFLVKSIDICRIQNFSPFRPSGGDADPTLRVPWRSCWTPWLAHPVILLRPTLHLPQDILKLLLIHLVEGSSRWRFGIIVFIETACDTPVYIRDPSFIVELYCFTNLFLFQIFIASDFFKSISQKVHDQRIYIYIRIYTHTRKLRWQGKTNQLKMYPTNKWRFSISMLV